jgi:hypothetical protein
MESTAATVTPDRAKAALTGQALTEGGVTDEYEADEGEDGDGEADDEDTDEGRRPAKKRKLEAGTQQRHRCGCVDEVPGLPSGVATGFGAGEVEIRLDRQGSISASI